MALPDLTKKIFSREEIVAILSATEPSAIEAVRAAAEKVLLKECGGDVFMRGLVEASNVCRCDCLYCGIRKSNKTVSRYTLSVDDIMAIARCSAQFGYGSMVIQTGERRDPAFLDMIEIAIKRIKEETKSDDLPEGLGVTLCIGEQTPETYRRLYEAGAHRYLLRIEATNPALFAKIHPPEQTLESRIACLKSLREIGYQVGTGVMIGLPGQTADDLAGDILFFKEMDVDMIGMGPFIPNEETPMGGELCPDIPTRLRLGLLMIAATRLVLRDVNIAATTALQALDPTGREKGLRFGANVMMPLMTPRGARQHYILYPGKPCLNETSQECHACLESRLKLAGRKLGVNQWGDSVHARRRGKSYFNADCAAQIGVRQVDSP